MNALRRSWLPLAFAVVTTLVIAAAYSPVRRGVFVWDDHVLVEPAATTPLAGLLSEPFFVASRNAATNGAEYAGRAAYYRPVVLLSFRVDRALFGPGPAGFHLVNVALHVFAALLLARVVRRFGASETTAFVVSLVWALFPRSTESVAWISGRTDVLATIGTLAALAAWPWYRGAATPAHPGARAGLASAALLFGLFSKEVAVAGAIAIAAGTCVRRDAARPAWHRPAVLLGPLVLYGALRFRAMAGVANATTVRSIGTVLETLGRYAEMVVTPWRGATAIGLLGEVDTARATFGGVVLASALVGVALGVRAVRRAAPEQRARLLLPCVGLVLLAAAVAPVLHVVPLGLNASVASDRLLYLPTCGLALAVATWPARPRPAFHVLGVVLAAAFAVPTYARAQDYTDELVFWTEAVETAHPRNTAPRSALANVVRERGDHALACAFHTSVRAILERTGRAGTPRHRRATENLGSCLALVGRYEEAEKVYASLASDAAPAWAFMGLGYVALHQFHFDRAREAFTRARAIDPSLDGPRASLAALPQLVTEARALETEEARRREPVRWARLAEEVGRVDDARAAWLALAEQPNTPPGVLQEATQFLQFHGTPEEAERALDRYEARGGPDTSQARARLALRKRQRAALEALRPRLLRLLP